MRKPRAARGLSARAARTSKCPERTATVSMVLRARVSTRRKASGGVQATVKEQIPPELMPEIARSLGLRQRFFAEGFAY